MKITGIANVTANLAKVAKAIEGAVADATRKAAMEVEREAKINCPVDTGNLRGSIGAEEKTPLFFEVGTNVEYSAAVEYGMGQRAQPYLGPAAEIVRAKYPNIIISEVKNEIDS